MTKIRIGLTMCLLFNCVEHLYATPPYFRRLAQSCASGRPTTSEASLKANKEYEFRKFREDQKWLAERRQTHENALQSHGYSKWLLSKESPKKQVAKVRQLEDQWIAEQQADKKETIEAQIAVIVGWRYDTLVKRMIRSVPDLGE